MFSRFERNFSYIIGIGDFLQKGGKQEDSLSFIEILQRGSLPIFGAHNRIVCTKNAFVERSLIAILSE